MREVFKKKLHKENMIDKPVTKIKLKDNLNSSFLYKVMYSIICMEKAH